MKSQLLFNRYDYFLYKEKNSEMVMIDGQNIVTSNCHISDLHASRTRGVHGCARVECRVGHAALPPSLGSTVPFPQTTKSRHQFLLSLLHCIVCFAFM